MKKVFTFFLYLLALSAFGNISLIGQTVAEQPPGDGSGANPWAVSTLAHLRWLGESTSIQSDTIIFTADIDASETRTWNNGEGFEPIGGTSATSSFNGMIDGQGHVIRNLYINRPGKDYVGLVERVRDVLTSEIKNLGIENCNITGQERVGAIAGDLDGRIINCYSSGRILASANAGGIVGYMNGNGTTINCYSSVTMIATNRRVGGFSGGFDPDSVSMCYSNGPVSGTLTDIGGFHGRPDATNLERFFSCYWDLDRSGQATSNGGVEVGLTTANMKKQASFVNWDFTGTWGIVEGVTPPFLKWQKIIVRNDLPVSTPTSTSLSKGYVYNNSTTGETISEYGYMYGLDSLPLFIGGMPSHGTKVSVVTGGSIAGGTGAEIAGSPLPKLTVGQVLYAVSYAIDNNGNVAYGDVVVVQAPLLTEGSGTEEDPFVIRTLTQLNALNVDLTLGDKYFILANDIDATDTKNWDGGAGWSPISGFSGSFDGQGYVVRNLFINRSTDYVGLFGRVNQGPAVIKNLGVVDCDITGRERVGALMGMVEDNKNTSNCFSSGMVKGRNMVGGLVGRINGSGYVENSFSTCNVYGTQSTDTRVGGFVGSTFGNLGDLAEAWNCYSTGFAYGSERAGGFVGRNLNGDAWYCYSSGSAAGNVSIGGFAGGFSAHDSTMYIKNYWDKSMTGLPGAGEDTEDYLDHIPDNHVLELTGLTTAEFMAAGSFVDWNFTGLWKIREGASRPYFENMKAVFVGAPPVLDYQNVTATAEVHNITAGDLVEAGFVFRSGDLTWSQVVADAGFTGPVAAGGSATITVQLEDVLEAGKQYSVQSYARDAGGMNYYGDASSIYFEEEAYDATVVVLDETDAPVAAATVELLGYSSLTTDANGEALFTDVVAGKKIALTVENTGYPKLVTSLEISGNATVTFNLSQNTFGLRFIVSDTAGNLLEAVDVGLLGGETTATDATGEAFFTAVTEATGILYEVALDGWVTVFGSETVTMEDTVIVAMEPRSVMVEVMDGDGAAIEGASVTLEGYGTQVTHASGMALFSPVNPANEVALDILADGFNTYSGTVDIMNETTAMSVTLDPTMVRFVIVDEADQPLENADIVLGEDILQTGGWGSADFMRVPSGIELQYSVNKFRYAGVTGSVTLSNKNDTLFLGMSRNRYNVTFMVTDMADAPVENAEVLVSGVDTIMTGASGGAVFEDVLTGSYTYSVKGGLKYEAASGTISVADKDENVAVKLAALYYNVSIKVTDESSNTLQGANVTLSGYGIMTTGADGIALFADVVPANNIVYSITLTGYSDTINVLNVVDSDVSIFVALVSASTDMPGQGNAGIIELWPVPASDFVNISVQTASGRIAVYNLTGKVIITGEITSDRMRLDFTDQHSGLYLVNVWDEKGVLVGNRKIVIRK